MTLLQMRVVLIARCSAFQNFEIERADENVNFPNILFRQTFHGALTDATQCAAALFLHTTRNEFRFGDFAVLYAVFAEVKRLIATNQLTASNYIIPTHLGF